jgi:group I intron endonuclease
MRTTFIYGLICPKTNTIKYIGKADDIKRRLRQHIYQSKYSDNNKNLWIKNLLKENYKPEIEVIDEVPINDWGYWEDFWIKYYKFLGYQLMNEMDGGHGYGKHSAETIEKIRQSQSGEKNSMYGKPSVMGMLGKTFSEESKKKISKANKGKLVGEKNPMYGKTHSLEVRKKISEANTGRKIKREPMSEEQKNKIRNSVLLYNKNKKSS